MQIQVITLMSTLQLIYIGYCAPFLMQWMNKLEIANEFLILNSTYFLFIYSDGFLLMVEPKVPDIKVKDWDAQE